MTRPMNWKSSKLLPLAIWVMLGVGALAPMVPASTLERVTVYGFEVRQSRGAKLRQHVTAEMAQVAPDDVRSVIADNPICRVILDNDEPSVEVTSSQLRYYMRGPERAPEEEEAAPALPVEVLRLWNGELTSGDGLPRVSDPSQGDFLFSSKPDGERVHVDMGERGELFARYLLWSEQYQRFVALGGFEQLTVNERGDRVRTRGIVFTADENFQNVGYPVIGDEIVEFEIE